VNLPKFETLTHAGTERKPSLKSRKGNAPGGRLHSEFPSTLIRAWLKLSLWTNCGLMAWTDHNSDAATTLRTTELSTAFDVSPAFPVNIIRCNVQSVSMMLSLNSTVPRSIKALLMVISMTKWILPGEDIAFIVMVALGSRCGHYIFILWFFSIFLTSSFFLT